MNPNDYYKSYTYTINVSALDGYFNFSSLGEVAAENQIEQQLNTMPIFKEALEVIEKIK